MLTILMGRAKTGKSEQVLRRIGELGDSSRQILLVPEHASHQAEVDLCRFCGDTASRHAEVLSFRRLCDRVLTVTGGAAQVTLVERHDGVARMLAANIERLKAAERVQLVAGDALRFAATAPAEPVDLLFVDPPFGQGLLRELLPLLATPGWLRPGGWLYVEHESQLPLSPPPGFSLHRQLKAGAATAQLWRRDSVAYS